MADTSDVYSMPCGRAVLTMPDPAVMTEEDVTEVEQWLALVMRRVYRLHAEIKGKAVCGRCGGDGGSWGRGVDQDGNQIRLTCTNCDGTGRVDRLHGEHAVKDGGQ